MTSHLKTFQQHILNGKVSEAMKVYDRLIQTDESFLDLEKLYKTFYFSNSESNFAYEKGERDRDLRSYRNFLKLLLKENPKDVNLLIHLAGVSYDFYIKREFLNVVRYADQVIKLDSNCKKAYELKSLSLEWIHNSEHKKGNASDDSGKIEQIKDTWECVLKLETDQKKRLKLKESIHCYEGKIKQAQESGKEGVYLEKAKRAFESGNVDGAIVHMNQMLKVTKEVDPTQVVEKGHLLLNSGKFDEAIKVFQSALPYFTNEVQQNDSWEGMGSAYLAKYKKEKRASDLDQAFEFLKKTYEHAPDNQRGMLLLAEVYVLSSDNKAAFKVLKKAMQKGCDWNRSVNDMKELLDYLKNHDSFKDFVKGKDFLEWIKKKTS